MEENGDRQLEGVSGFFIFLFPKLNLASNLERSWSLPSLSWTNSNLAQIIICWRFLSEGKWGETEKGCNSSSQQVLWVKFGDTHCDGDNPSGKYFFVHVYVHVFWDLLSFSGILVAIVRRALSLCLDSLISSAYISYIYEWCICTGRQPETGALKIWWNFQSDNGQRPQ